MVELPGYPTGPGGQDATKPPADLQGVKLEMNDTDLAALGGEENRLSDERGQEWIVMWHPPELPAPAGKPHGSAGICFTPEEGVVLVTWPGVGWEFPAGRPEGDEDWRATLDREVLEEACAIVESATLLGFIRASCIEGLEEGLVLVRSLWCANVSLKLWEPRHETTARLVVPSHEVMSKVGFGNKPFYRRWFRDALAVKGLA